MTTAERIALLEAAVARLKALDRAPHAVSVHAVETNGARSAGGYTLSADAVRRNPGRDDLALMWRLAKDRIPLAVWRGERDPEVRA